MTEIPWLDEPMARFEARLRRGQAPQGLLVHGPAGVGRRHFALSVAARLLGSDWRPAAGLDPDQLPGVPHPDYFGVGLDDESRVIKVEQIREFMLAVQLTSHHGGRKVGLIFPAEAMTANAANSLLKTLEEPPAATTLLLVVESPARLPATILSRCERIRLAVPRWEIGLAWLSAGHTDHGTCANALAFSSRAPLAARALLTDDYSKLFAALTDDLQGLVQRTTPPTTVARHWAKRDTGFCLRWLYLQTAELLRRHVRPKDAPNSSLQLLKIPDAPLNMAACCAYLDQIMEAQRLKDRSLNLEALFADLLMWWYGAAGALR